MFRQGLGDEVAQLCRVGVPFTADADGQYRRMQHEVFRFVHAAICYQNAGLCRRINGQAGVREPAGVAGLNVQAHGRARQQGGGDGKGLLAVGHHPSGGRIIDADAVAQVAGRGHGGADTQGLGDLAGQNVGARMPAQQRHHGAAVLGHGNHRRLGDLVGQQRGQGADQNARGEDADHRVPGLKQAGGMAGGFVEEVIGLGHPADPAMDQRRRNDALQAAGQRRPRFGHGEDDGRGGGHVWGSVVSTSSGERTRIMEK